MRGRLSRAEVGRVLRFGRKVSAPHLSLAALARDGSPSSAFAIVVSKKIASRAVSRNRLRRRLRETLRRHPFSSPLAIVLVARAGAGELSFTDLAAEVSLAVSRLSSRR